MALVIGVLIGAVVLAAIYKYILYPAFFSPLAKIPAANFSARFSNLWLRYIRFVNNENRTVYAMHVKHGPIVRLGPNELSINCIEEGVKTVYGGGFPKSTFYSQYDFYGHKNTFTTLDSPTHAARKRMFSHTFSKSFLLASPSLRATTAHMLHARLLPVLAAHADSSSATSQTINVLPLAHAFAMDAFTAFQFGLRRASNFVRDGGPGGERAWYLGAYMPLKKHGFWFTEMPALAAWLRRGAGVDVVPPRLAAGMAELEAWNLEKCEGAQRAVAVVAAAAEDDGEGRRRKKGGEEDEDEEEREEKKPENRPTVFAAQFAAYRKAYGDDELVASSPQKKEAGGGKEDEEEKEKHRGPNPQPQPRPNRRLELASDQFDFNVAALETSGLTLTWLLYEVSQRPALQARLREECAALDPPLVFPASSPPLTSSTPPLPDLPDPRRLDALPLLDAVLQETLRRWPAVAGRQPRVTPQGGSVTLAGYAGIPPGVTVQAYAYSLHRNGAVFPAPEEWRPERWMAGGEEGGGDLAEMRRWFWAFGSGGRVCVGKHFAFNALKYAVAAIYTNFSTEVVDAEGIEQSDGFIASPKGEKLVLRFRRV